MTVTEQRARFSVAEVLRMAEAGIFEDWPRTELIEGELLVMAPIGAPHVGAVNHLLRAFAALVATDVVEVSIQNPLQLDDHSCPEPDFVALRPGRDRTQVPQAADALLVAEVADASRVYDRGRKADLYAATGIAEYWVVDVVARTVEVRTLPVGGTYSELHTVRSGSLRPTLVEVTVEAAPLFS